MHQITSGGSTPSTPTWPHVDPAVWSLLGGILWFLLVVILLIAFRREIVDIVRALASRIKTGAAFKVFSVEFGPIRASRSDSPTASLIASEVDRSGQWGHDRDSLYAAYRHVFIAHRLFPSEMKGMLYDILIYLVPHEGRGGSLRGISRVEYFFGNEWNNRVFTATDSGKRFAIVVSAYGSGFLCTAKIFFGADSSVETWRYIDFEMGPLGDGGHALESTEST